MILSQVSAILIPQSAIGMDQKVALLEQRVSNLLRFLPRPLAGEGGCEGNAIQEKLTELAKNEAEVYRVAFDKEKELTDRALKLS